jgi:hypothetical protein
MNMWEPTANSAVWLLQRQTAAIGYTINRVILEEKSIFLEVILKVFERENIHTNERLPR